ncbi:hypothetical protein [Nocardia beijingensis]
MVGLRKRCGGATLTSAKSERLSRPSVVAQRNAQVAPIERSRFVKKKSAPIRRNKQVGRHPDILSVHGIGNEQAGTMVNAIIPVLPAFYAAEPAKIEEVVWSDELKKPNRLLFGLWALRSAPMLFFLALAHDVRDTDPGVSKRLSRLSVVILSAVSIYIMKVPVGIWIAVVIIPIGWSDNSRRQLYRLMMLSIPFGLLLSFIDIRWIAVSVAAGVAGFVAWEKNIVHAVYFAVARADAVTHIVSDIRERIDRKVTNRDGLIVVAHSMGGYLTRMALMDRTERREPTTECQNVSVLTYGSGFRPIHILVLMFRSLRTRLLVYAYCICTIIAIAGLSFASGVFVKSFYGYHVESKVVDEWYAEADREFFANHDIWHRFWSSFYHLGFETFHTADGMVSSLVVAAIVLGYVALVEKLARIIFNRLEAEGDWRPVRCKDWIDFTTVHDSVGRIAAPPVPGAVQYSVPGFGLPLIDHPIRYYLRPGSVGGSVLRTLVIGRFRQEEFRRRTSDQLQILSYVDRIRDLVLILAIIGIVSSGLLFHAGLGSMGLVFAVVYVAAGSLRQVLYRRVSGRLGNNPLAYVVLESKHPPESKPVVTAVLLSAHLAVSMVFPYMLMTRTHILETSLSDKLHPQYRLVGGLFLLIVVYDFPKYQQWLYHLIGLLTYILFSALIINALRALLSLRVSSKLIVIQAIAGAGSMGALHYLTSEFDVTMKWESVVYVVGYSVLWLPSLFLAYILNRSDR